MSLDSSTSSLLVATVSVLGFSLTVGLPTLMAIAYQALLGRKQQQLLTDFVPRFLSKFVDSGWLTYFYWISLFYIAAVLLDLINALFGLVPNWVYLWSDLIGVALTLGGLVVLYFTVIRVSIKEVEQFKTGQRRSYQAAPSATVSPTPSGSPTRDPQQTEGPDSQSEGGPRVSSSAKSDAKRGKNSRKSDKN